MTITVYSKPDYVQCAATYRALGRRGIAYRAVDVTAAEAALAYVVALGYAQVPVVDTGTEHWSGYRPDRITVLAERTGSSR